MTTPEVALTGLSRWSYSAILLMGKARLMHDFDTWLHALDERHLADLTFPEVSRALRALSSAYVERREPAESGSGIVGRR